MTPTLFPSIQAVLAQIHPDTIAEDAYRQWSPVMLVLLILSILLITALLLLVSLRRARRRRASLPKPKDTEHIDAWAEAGRRFDNSITEIDVEDD